MLMINKTYPTLCVRTYRVIEACTDYAQMKAALLLMQSYCIGNNEVVYSPTEYIYPIDGKQTITFMTDK